MSRVPQVGLVGPASATFPVVASGEPVSVPDNLLKICKAKPVIFKGKCSSARGGGGEPTGSRSSSDTDSPPSRIPGCPPGKTPAFLQAMEELSRPVTNQVP
ncbi:hypothetical protein MC885_001802 [Smutsia gigantea]|nr:hypothetical protein MC885_001802 [Smutsia gigantea]